NHPDSTDGDKAVESRVKDISTAYNVLGDAKKRELYDQIRAGGGVMPRGFPGGAQYTYSGQGPGPGVFDLGDLFGQFFSQGAQGRGGRVRVEQMDMDDEPRGRRRRRDAQDVDFEQKVKAADG